MILSISSSSPQVSVALLDEEGHALFSEAQPSNNAASSAIFAMLERCFQGFRLSDVRLFVADLGPGSFIGVRVGVTIAKTLAFANERQAAGIDAFDLIGANESVILPSKKGEYFVRKPGKSPFRTAAPSFEGSIGYGAGFETPVFPHAVNVGLLLPKLVAVEPDLLLPKYLIEPSISTPKKPFIRAT